MNDILASYMRDARRHPVLTREEEMDLATKYAETKDPAIAHRLVVANLRLVLDISRRMTRDKNLRLDLVQEGNLGLYDAVERFDRTRGHRFCTYAEYRIKSHMLEFMRKSRQFSVNANDAESVFAGLKNAACPPHEQPAAMVERSQEQKILNEKLLAFEKTLDARKWAIFRRHILSQDESTADLGAAFGVSRERVEQLKTCILSQLKKFLARELNAASLAY